MYLIKQFFHAHIYTIHFNERQIMKAKNKETTNKSKYKQKAIKCKNKTLRN